MLFGALSHLKELNHSFEITFDLLGGDEKPAKSLKPIEERHTKKKNI